MINGLNYNGFEQLNGLHLLYADEIQIDKIDQKEINTLDNINTTTTIQEQIDNLDETYVNYDYLYDTYYHYIRDWFTNEFSTKTDIKEYRSSWVVLEVDHAIGSTYLIEAYSATGTTSLCAIYDCQSHPAIQR